MSDRGGSRSDIRAGVFLVAALLILGVGTLWIAGLNPLGGGEVRYEVLMKGSSGVRRGDRIRVSGIEVGRVRSVELDTGGEWPVIFEVTVERGVEIGEGSVARITTDGLLGAPYLEIVSPAAGAAPLPEGSRIFGTEGGTITHTLEGLGQATDRLPELLEQTTELVTRINREIDPLVGRFRALLSDANLEEVSATLAALRPAVEEVGPKLAVMVERLESLAEEVEEAVGGVPEVADEIGGLAADLRQALGPGGERLGRMLGSAESALGSVDGALSVVDDNGVELEATLRDLRDAAANLKSFTQTLKERPGLLLRYPRPPDRKPGEGAEK